MAHIPDGFLSPPVLGATAAVAAAAVAVASRRTPALVGEREAPLLGAVTAFVFAAQMVNVPLGAGTSSHLMGGALVAVLVGPWAAMLSLFGVVLVQALLFQDGGVAALGANTLNLAVLAPAVGWVVYRWLGALLPAGRQALAGALAGFASVVAVGAAVALQLAASGLVPVERALLVVGGAHVLAAGAEALITGAVLTFLLRARPELLAAGEPLPATRRRVRGLTAAAAGLALVGAYAASGAPDALERASALLGLGHGGAALPAPLAGYTAPGGAWVAALAGVGAAFAAGWVALRAVARRGG